MPAPCCPVLLVQGLLALTSTVLQFLFSLPVYFKWHLPHATDGAGRQSSRGCEYGGAVLGLCSHHGYFFQLKQACAHSSQSTAEDNVGTNAKGNSSEIYYLHIY